MAENRSAPSQDEERAEFEAVTTALAKSPRLVRLMRYLGEKYFKGESDQLHEYNIATEVFGRSKTAFDAGEDAIARVEAHRLRKKLKEFYEKEGRGRPVQLSIPSGTYVPVFTFRSDLSAPGAPNRPDASVNPADSELFAGAVAAGEQGELRPQGWIARQGRRIWLYALPAAAGLVAVLSIFLIFHKVSTDRGGGVSSSPAATPGKAQTDYGSAAFAPIHIIAGYSGKPQIDSAGTVWEADQYFHEGGTWARPKGFIARTSDPFIFDQWRTGDFFYDIPLKPGVYELHLYFVTAAQPNDPPSTFTVSVNGEKILTGFDVNSDALGANIADERIFRDVSPSKDGYLHLAFTSESGSPMLNALEILPGTPHKQLPIRLVTQPTSFTDHLGQFWHPDNYFMNGRLSTQEVQISGTPDPGLFSSERYGHFTYALPVDTRDRYTLVLYFAEHYFGPHATSGAGGAGSRIFKVMCNGETLLDNFDIYKEAGSLHALTKTFYHLKPTAQGKLNLTFEPIQNNATVSAIEVLDESQ